MHHDCHNDCELGTASRSRGVPCAHSRVSRHLLAPTPRQALVTGADYPDLVAHSDIYHNYY
eukprot:scaffold79206_cov99-Phaeocystis_antarctica.AAC.1